MLFERGLVVVRSQREMKFTFAQIIWLRVIFETGELKRKSAAAVAHENYCKRAVRRFFAADLFESESFVIEFYALVEIFYIEVKMIEFVFHAAPQYL